MRLPSEGVEGREPVLGTFGNVVIGAGRGTCTGVFGGVGAVTGLAAGNDGLQQNCPACAENAAELMMIDATKCIDGRQVI
jgi:hypothetical protein